MIRGRNVKTAFVEEKKRFSEGFSDPLQKDPEESKQGTGKCLCMNTCFDLLSSPL